MASYYQSSFIAKFSNIAMFRVSLAFVTVKKSHIGCEMTLTSVSKASPRFAGPPAIKILIGGHPPFISMPQARPSRWARAEC
ncbi:hypothetical protein L195_g041702 [Trifolium pratense]|uniref:Uncharacterized protein n=1 Tax=Trifolium pratense TaxID=57577 RepID=A0A2K3M4B3_TRIPR|nr:hypothetical protein L195_g041702 [Trifolium pratense]